MIDPARYPVFHGSLNSAGTDVFGCCVQVAGAAEWQPGTAFTVEGWVRWNGTGVIQTLLSKPIPRSPGHVVHGLSLQLESGVPVLKVQTAGGERVVPWRQEAQVRAHTWVHLAATYDGRTAVLYRDGIEVSRGSWSDPAPVLWGPVPLTLGGEFEVDLDRSPLRDSVWSRSLAGSLSNVRVWQTVLSAEVIGRWSHREDVNGHPQQGALVAHWRLDEGTGRTLRDSGNRRWDGTFLFAGDPLDRNPWEVLYAPDGTVRPGASASGAVNLATGRVEFTLPLAEIAPLRGLGASVALRYSSAVEEAVGEWSLEAPTGGIGLGWSLLGERILRDSRGDTAPDNDTYLLLTPEGAHPLIYGGGDSDGQIYASANAPYWKIRYRQEYELWVVIREDGTRFFFGGNEKTPFGPNNPVEWSVAWGNWIGVSASPTGQQRYASAWNLSCRENPENDRVLYTYGQSLQPVGPRGNTSQPDPRQTYTAACRLMKITGALQDSILFTYQEKDPTEYARWDVYEEPALPPAEAGHQDRLDTQYLALLAVYGPSGATKGTVHLDYGFLGSEKLKKRILKGITFRDAIGSPRDLGHGFTYFGEDAADGVRVALDNAAHPFEPTNGALYGALRAHRVPEGATYSYRYARVTLDGATRDVVIQAPEGNWGSPRTYFGPDYVVLLWAGVNGNNGRMYLQVYTWTGGWTLADFAVLPVKHGVAAEVTTRGEFFAVVTPQQDPQVNLYTRNPARRGEWLKHSFALPGAGRYAVGARFFAWLDPGTGRLTRLHREGGAWAQTEVVLKAAGVTRFALAAEGDILFTITATPDNSFAPDGRVHRLDHGGNWLMPEQSLHQPMSHRAETVSRTTYSGITELSVRMGDGFAVVQTHHWESTSRPHDQGGGISEREFNPFFAHRWNERCEVVEIKELPVATDLHRSTDYRPRLVVAGSMVLIDAVPPKAMGLISGVNRRWAFRFLGDRWGGNDYSHDSLQNNFVGIDSFTITNDGKAQFYEWNHLRSEWVARIGSFADGNPTLWEKVWGYLYLIEMVLTLPLDWEIALPLDLAFMLTDQLMSQLANPEVAAARANRFFAAGNQLHYRQPNGKWNDLGSLVAEYRGRRVGEWDESLRLQRHSTQAAGSFITYVAELNQTQEVTYPGPPPDHIPQKRTETRSGYPKTTPWVRLLKNGGTFGQPFKLPDGEWLTRHSDDQSELIGADIFVTYCAGKLGDATRLHLYRVINDACTGPLTTYVAASEAVNDGMSVSYTHYRFENGLAQPSGSDALFNKTTVIPSGPSASPDLRNGCTEHFFYTGGGNPLEVKDSDSMLYPVLAGSPYYTRTFRSENGNLAEARSERLRWWVRKLPLVRNETMFLPRVAVQTTLADGMLTTVMSSFPDETKGLPLEVYTSHKNLAGEEEHRLVSYRYAWALHPDLERQNLLTALAETRTTVNQRLVEATGYQWSRLGPELSGDPDRWSNLRYPVWGARSAFVARNADAPMLQRSGEPPPEHWLRTLRAVGQMPRGIVTETVDADGRVTSTVYDTEYRYALASFAGASVSEAQAGYLGFSQIERKEGWQLTGTHEPLGGGRTGTGRLAGSTASVRPGRFSPRPGIGYVVGAWIQTREGGAGAAIGFGANARTIPAAPTWRYVEHTVTSPTPDAAPFVRCDGNIDCIHFRPVDAGFSATVYDPDTGLPLSHQDQLGNIRRTAYNDAHEAIIETGPGEQPLRMYTRTYASQLARALHAALLPENDRADLRPNIRLMVSSQDGGRYTGPGPWLIRGGEGVPLLSGPFETPGRPRSLATPTGTALRFTVRHGADARLQILNGSATLEFEQGLIRLIDRSGRNWQFKGDPGSYEFLVAVIGNQLLLFAGARLLLRQEITEPGAFTLRSAPNSTAPCEVRHVATMVSPVLTLAYADGLGREIQLQTMHPNGTGLIAAQTIYDGWGQAAVHTKPAPIGWSAQYQPGLVTAYDWTSGRLHGEVSLYFRSIPEVAGSPDDAYFACTRQVSERSPLARALEQCNPGKRFAPGGGLTVRMDYSRTADAKWLYQQVGLPQTDAYRSVTRYLPLGPGQINPHVEIFDRAGNRIASAIGIGPERTATSYRSRRDPSGEWMITSLPNRQNPAFPDLGESGTTATHVDFLGHPDERRDPDSGTLLRIGDPVGRLRFYMDAAGAAQSPQRFQYLVYDAAGRPVEHGELTQAWSPQQLRQAAADRAWPSREPGATWMTRWLYDCDGTAETAKANGRLRELQSCGPDRQVVTKRYFYDTHGRAVRVDQLVPGFDATTRSVLYDYDAQDRVIAIHYPGERQRSVYHTFNAAGRLWRVGEDGQPARFAEYAYTVDGAVARELLNERRIQGRYRYDFHGRLLDIDYTGPGDQRYFQTTLEYGSENLGAAVTSVTSGASLATPKPHRYRYAYNSLSRLIMASTDPAAGLQLEPRWEFTGPYGGPVGIDPNGNLQARRDGGMVYAPSYAPGSNRLDALSLMGQPAQRVQHDASGRLRSLLNLRSLSYSGARVVPDSVEIPTGTVQLRYNGAGQRVLKLAGSRKRLYVHGQGGLPVAEFTGNSAEEVQYVQGATGLTAYLRDGKPYFVIRDQLGSTRLVLDGDGKHVAHYNYLPFGGLQPDNSTNPKESPLQYLYTGQEFDMELGCYNYRARLYDPALGRFHCPDPAGEWSSPYAYVGNNPISRTDPSGLLSRVQLRLALGLAYTSVYAAVGAGIGYASGGDSEERKRRAGIGAIVGASFGAFRGITEAGIGLWRSGWGANAGAPQPIIVYYEGQQLYGLATGRMGAELIAEAQRIPRSRWGTHLISRERIDGGRAAWPQVAEFNGQLIAVGHGTEGAAAAELGIYRQGEVYQAADGRLHTRSAWAGSEGLRSFVPTRFTVTNVDLSVCYAARSGFAVDVGATFTARRGANVPVRSGANTVSPLGAWHTSGHVRDVGLGVNTLEMIFGIPLSWTRIF